MNTQFEWMAWNLDLSQIRRSQHAAARPVAGRRADSINSGQKLAAET